MTDCPHRDDVASYVLGALPPDEHERFVAHLEGCADCRAAVTELQVVADTLPLAAVQVAPPPQLRDRIMAVARSEAELLAAAGAGADRPAPARRRWWRRPVLALRPLPAAIGAAALIALGVAGGIVFTGTSSERTVTGQVMASTPGARATVVLSDDGSRLRVRGMPAPPRGKVYEVWTKRASRPPQPTAALFTVDRRGNADVEIASGRLKGVDQVLVTAEPKGGSRTPTSKPVIVASTA